MKKLILIASALVISVTMFAGIKDNAKANSAKEATRVEMKKVEKDGIAKQRQASIDVVNPYLVTNVETFTCAPYTDGINYIPECAIISPYAKELEFSSYYSSVRGNKLVNTWFLDDEEQASGRTFVEDIKIGDISSPLMKTESVSVDTITYNFIDFQYGAQAAKLITEGGYGDASPYLMVAPPYTMPLTKMLFYAEDPAAVEDDPLARDFFWLGSGYPGDGYKYGTKLVDPFASDAEHTKYIDTIFVPYANSNGTMYITEIRVGIVSEKATGAEMFPGENDHVRVSLYPLDMENGAIDWENPIAQTTANADNFDGKGNYGYLHFVFTEEDPVTHAESEVPVIVNGAFVVALDEFNDGTANFAIFGNYYNPIDGETFFVSNDSIFQLYDKPSPNDGRTRYASEIMVVLEAFLPAFDIQNHFNVAEAGATIELDVPSNVWDEDMEIDADEWINVEVVTDYEEVESNGQTYQNHKFINHVTITVDPTDAPRIGTIEFDAVGKIITVTIDQSGAEGIENVSFKNDNKMYNVLGVEVNEDYKGIVIRNGEKFVR